MTKQSDKSGWEFAEKVTNGDILAAHWVRQACKRALDDRDNAKERGYYYDADAANRVIKFFSFLKHLKGALAGQPFELADWQIFIVSQLYGWKRTSDNLRRFRTCYILCLNQSDY